MGKKHWVRSEAFGFNGAIWVLWDEQEVEMKLIMVRRPFLHMEVRFGVGESCRLTRKYIWDQLDSLKLEKPLMLISDFSYVLNNEERCSKTGASTMFKN